MGSTFFFIDIDYGSEESDLDDISLAYWEIARSFKISKSFSFEPRIEYNGGLGGYNINDITYQYSINSAFLVGGQYTWNNADFSKVLTLQGNYKYIKDKEDASFQLTAVWGLQFFNRKLSLTGFADFWKEENTYVDEEATDYVFLTEPQIWYNAMDHFSVGGEVEMASNFGGHKGFKVCPTVAVKWIF
jgi:hypothetical protein